LEIEKQALLAINDRKSLIEIEHSEGSLLVREKGLFMVRSLIIYFIIPGQQNQYFISIIQEGYSKEA
jgi:hypothetical protein